MSKINEIAETLAQAIRDAVTAAFDEGVLNERARITASIGGDITVPLKVANRQATIPTARPKVRFQLRADVGEDKRPPLLKHFGDKKKRRKYGNRGDAISIIETKMAAKPGAVFRKGDAYDWVRPMSWATGRRALQELVSQGKVEELDKNSFRSVAIQRGVVANA